MEMFGIAAMMLVMTLFLVSLYYIQRTFDHKENLRLIEKGMNPLESAEARFKRNSMKYGIMAMMAGVGFVVGMTLEESRWFSSELEMPLYLAPILIFTGLGLVLSVRFSSEN